MRRNKTGGIVSSLSIKAFRHKIKRSHSGVAQAAKETSSGMSQTQEAATELSRMAADLQELVGQFKY